MATSGQAVWKVLRGGAFNNDRDNARCAYRNRNQPDNRNDNIGFRVVLRSPTFFRPFFWFRQFGGTAHRSMQAGGVPEMRADSPERGLPAEAKEEEQRQTGLVRARGRKAESKRGASIAPGAYASSGTA